ncbi:YhcN/YlaJ family sporulation lipoprotein [Clostridium sp. MSJ-11]|uniref:YhcN/YlaJ family sporulation lipoprotein n=1 Tax=Clostridium mobile TaxID=2841512 RepID=A0ABS6ECJ7_9CLOT|nr:YhcN/YlaJ family sporulation lipoprotein [Clostridium mobile]MBU5482913.1 YhcN/YlaJ family sporulation lipoprotein [Clostridium mobile]
MNKIKSKKIFALLLTTVLTSGMMACGTTGDQNGTQQPNTNQQQNAAENQVLPNTDNTTMQNEQNTAELTQRADKIAKELTTIKGINSANVLISNERALVGVNLDENAEGNLTNELKTEVEKKVKSTDPKIQTVAVSADVDVVQRIQNIGKGIGEGRPFSEFGTEIEEIFRRILPQ